METISKEESRSLPLTVNVALLRLSPASHMYSPPSSTDSLWISKVWIVPSLFMKYFFPSDRTWVPFFQVTLGQGIEVSQHNEALPPSVTSWLVNSFENDSTGISGRKQWYIEHVLRHEQNPKPEDYEEFTNFLCNFSARDIGKPNFGMLESETMKLFAAFLL